MKQIENYEEYKALISDEKQKCKRLITNCFLLRGEIKKIIEMKRMFYLEDKEDLMFIVDEGTYYKMFYHFTPKAKIDIPRLDKDILIRNIFKKDNKSEELKQIEEKLINQGCSLYDQSIQILAKPKMFEDEVHKKLEKMEQILSRAGFTIGYAQPQHLEAIIELRDNTDELKKYHIDYMTDEQMLEEIDKGYIRCITDKDDNICAAQQYKIDNGVIQGDWLAVGKAYQVSYGMGMALAYHSFAYAIQKEIECYFGWVATDNMKSIKYHKAIGYELTDRIADEWVMEKR